MESWYNHISHAVDSDDMIVKRSWSKSSRGSATPFGRILGELFYDPLFTYRNLLDIPDRVLLELCISHSYEHVSDKLNLNNGHCHVRPQDIIDRVERVLHGSRRDKGRKSSAKKAKVEPELQAVAATQPSTAAVQEGMDVEMTDAGNYQQSYTAAEVDAANALLLLCQPRSQEIIDAANILMTLHGSNDGAETEDEVSDTEMDDAEKAEFMADFQARSWMV